METVGFCVALCLIVGLIGVDAKRNKVLLILFDGYRYNFNVEVNSTHLDALVDGGVRAEYVTPTFPSSTSPSMMTIATGLYTESHGVIGNVFVNRSDSTFSSGWYETCVNQTTQEWWTRSGAEPIWITAEKNNLTSGAYKWCGSEFSYDGLVPTFLEKLTPYTWLDAKGTALDEKERIDDVLEWLQTADVVVLHIDDVDMAMHYYGLNSTRGKDVLQIVDATVGHLMQTIDANDTLRDTLNVIITSDHGHTYLTPPPPANTIELYKLTNASNIEMFVGGLVYPFEGKLDQVYDDLTQSGQKMKVYKKDELPKRFHYTLNDRIAPIILLPDPGYVVTTIYRPSNKTRNGTPMTHGYDNDLMDMKSVFYAYGPNFKQGLASAAPFHHVDIYPLMCEILQIPPAPNNGSLENVRHILRTLAPIPTVPKTTVASSSKPVYTGFLEFATIVCGLIIVRHTVFV